MALQLLAKYLRGTNSLTHLDLSNCSISSGASQVLSSALASNTMLRGLHLAGNGVTVDARGFVERRTREHGFPALPPPVVVYDQIPDVGLSAREPHGERRHHRHHHHHRRKVGAASVKIGVIDALDDAVQEETGVYARPNHHGHAASKASASTTRHLTQTHKLPDTHSHSRSGSADESARKGRTLQLNEDDVAADGRFGMHGVDETLALQHASVRIIPADVGVGMEEHLAKFRDKDHGYGKQSAEEQVTADPCWICGGWRPYVFTWRPGLSGPAASRVYLLTSFDRFRVKDALKLDDDGVFRLARMVPPGIFRFLFEVDGVLRASQEELYERRDEVVEPTSGDRFRSVVREAMYPSRDRDGFLAAGGILINYFAPDMVVQRKRAAILARADKTRRQGGAPRRGDARGDSETSGLTAVAPLRRRRTMASSIEKAFRKADKGGALLTAKSAGDMLGKAFRRQDSLSSVFSGSEPSVESDDESPRMAMRRGISLSSIAGIRRAAKKLKDRKTRAAEAERRSKLGWVVTGTSFRTAVKRLGFVALSFQRKDDLVVLPRQKPLAIESDEGVWSKKDSVFRTYIEPNESLLSAAFNRDWEYTKIPRFIKAQDQLQAVKRVLRDHYFIIISAFKYAAAAGDPGRSSCFSVQWSNYVEDFVKQIHLLDDGKVKLSDCDLLFVQTNAPNVGQPKLERNPDRALTRFQFMETIVRLAKLRYLEREDDVETMQEAVRLLLENYVVPYARRDTLGQAWRHEELYVKEVDTVLREYLDDIKELYMNFSGRDQYATERPTMSMNEWLDMMLNFGDLDSEEYDPRDVKLAFVYSMQVVEDEMVTNKAQEADLVEVYEALCRVAALYEPTELRGPVPLCLKVSRLLQLLVSALDSGSDSDDSGDSRSIENDGK